MYPEFFQHARNLLANSRTERALDFWKSLYVGKRSCKPPKPETNVAEAQSDPELHPKESPAHRAAMPAAIVTGQPEP